MFALIREMEPRQCLELGSSLGLSAAYQASAIQLNGSGQLDTLEGAATIADRARANLDELSVRATVTTGRFQDTLEPLLKERPGIDVAFLAERQVKVQFVSVHRRGLPLENNNLVVVLRS